MFRVIETLQYLCFNAHHSQEKNIFKMLSYIPLFRKYRSEMFCSFQNEKKCFENAESKSFHRLIFGSSKVSFTLI